MKLRTCVYIDGFNLYYRCLKDTPYKWLDLYRMAELLLPADRHEITKVKFLPHGLMPGAMIPMRPGGRMST